MILIQSGQRTQLFAGAMRYKGVRQSGAPDSFVEQQIVVRQQLQYGGGKTARPGVFFHQQQGSMGAGQLQNLLFRQGLDPAGIKYADPSAAFRLDAAGGLFRQP